MVPAFFATTQTPALQQHGIGSENKKTQKPRRLPQDSHAANAAHQTATSIVHTTPKSGTVYRKKIRHGIRGASTFHTGDRLMKPPEFSESGPY